ncbi:MAG: beta-ketoacyl-ACP synthase II [Chloroflexi bacterium]|nr:beta-ketoacyl-ACP synthase II [Chloroflexota bacterium]
MDRVKRVALTGVGALTPIGQGSAGLWAGVLRGASGVGRITQFDAEPFASRIAGEVHGFEPLDWMDRKKARRLDRFSQFALAASRMALDDAGLTLEPGSADDVAVYIGSALGGLAYAEHQHTRFLGGGLRSIDPMLALSVFNGAGSCNVAMELGATGPNVANANSCAAGAVAVGEAFRLIKCGAARAAVAGGVETPLAPLVFSSFSVIRALSKRNEEPCRASRPFDRDRDGFVMAEAAAVVVLEDYESAEARGARIYCEVLGYGLTNDAYHMTAPLPDGSQSARAMQLALREARLAPEDVAFLNAHASSTQLGDSAEVAAIEQVVGSHVSRLAVGGTKGLHAHALGASGAEELAVTALGLYHGYQPPVINLEHPDPGCPLTFVPPGGLDGNVDFAMTNSFGFGGINSSLVLGRVVE